MSDRWFDISFWHSIDLSEIQVPDEDYPHTKLLNLRPMHVSALGDEKF
jgi:activating signal cointegrator complex subunit 3